MKDELKKKLDDSLKRIKDKAIQKVIKDKLEQIKKPVVKDDTLQRAE